LIDFLLQRIPPGLSRYLIRLWTRKLFRGTHRYVADLRNPKNYEEKIHYRKIYGNDLFYAKVADKYRAREYVTEKVGEGILIPLIGVYDRLTERIFEDLPHRFIIKTNHGCKWHRIVADKSNMDIGETLRYFNRMVKKRYGWRRGEIYYDFIKPKIIIEELLLEDGQLPWNYNFFCYNGSNGFDYSVAVASPDSLFRGRFDRDWNVWDSNLTEAMTARYGRPKNFERMVEIARLLSADFDFVRVDLYNIDGCIYFGELTCTSGAGLLPSQDLDPFVKEMRNNMWEVDFENRLLYRKPRYGMLPF
jgi:hypothetical protein